MAIANLDGKLVLGQKISVRLGDQQKETGHKSPNITVAGSDTTMRRKKKGLAVVLACSTNLQRAHPTAHDIVMQQWLSIRSKLPDPMSPPTLPMIPAICSKCSLHARACQCQVCTVCWFIEQECICRRCHVCQSKECICKLCLA